MRMFSHRNMPALFLMTVPLSRNLSNWGPHHPQPGEMKISVTAGSTFLTILRHHCIILWGELLIKESSPRNCGRDQHHRWWLTLITKSQFYHPFTDSADRTMSIGATKLPITCDESVMSPKVCPLLARKLDGTRSLTASIHFMSLVYFFIYFPWLYSSHLLGSRHYCDSRAVQPKVEMWQQHSRQVRLDDRELVSCILKTLELHLVISGAYSSVQIISLKFSPTTINCYLTFRIKFLSILPRICSYNRHYAEHSGYWETTSFLQEVCGAKK